MTRRRQEKIQAVLSVMRPGEDHYALDLAQAAGLSVGAIYPLLARLERTGVVTSAWERGDDSDLAPDPPRRRVYRLARVGAAGAPSGGSP